MIFWRFLAAKEWITTKWMEIDNDYQRTGTAIGFRASCELCSNYLFHFQSNQIWSPIYWSPINLMFRIVFRFSMHFRSAITWSAISWSAINWAYFMPIWLADSDLSFRYCANGHMLRVDAIGSKRRHSNDINDTIYIVCCQKYVLPQIKLYGSIYPFYFSTKHYAHACMHMPLCTCVNCRSDWRREAMFLVRISNELLIATFNRQLSDLIRQYSAINLMGDLMDD